MNKPICIYHGGCADGFTAAWAVWKRFGDSFDYHPGIYQDPPPDVAGRDVVLVDFSYKRPVLLEMAKAARSLLVLDHHKTAREDLEGLGYIPSAWEAFSETDDPAARIGVVFDMERSGAGITWDFFHPGEPRPELVNYVEDRDLWRFGKIYSRAINALIFSYDYSWENWNHLATMLNAQSGLHDAEAAGSAIERKHHKDVAELVGELRREIVIAGHWVPVANLPKTLTSDAGHLMCKPYASPNLQGEIITPLFAACYWDAPEGRVFSLRSVGDFDVSEIAKKYGGGGHKSAAGFRLPHGVEP